MDNNIILIVGEAFRLPRDGKPVPYKSKRIDQSVNPFAVLKSICFQTCEFFDYRKFVAREIDTPQVAIVFKF